MLTKMDIIEKLKNAGLTGKGGAGFPTWRKWEAVRNAIGNKKYVICNGSEGEPFVFKDKSILEHWPEEVVNGIRIALETIGGNGSAYIYLNKSYYQQFKDILEPLISGLPISLFEKHGGYLAGEETTLLNVIEGKRIEPRLKPPYPTEQGLWGQPTLINNVETLYWVSKIAKDEYKNNRFYCISGAIDQDGIFELPESHTIEQILKETNNYPSADFFVQIGGGASGAIMLPSDLNQPIKGAGAILVYDKASNNPMDLMKAWAEFFIRENCDQCVPCREGIYRLNEIFLKGDLKKEILNDIFSALEVSLCPLGRMAAVPFKTALEKLF